MAIQISELPANLRATAPLPKRNISSESMGLSIDEQQKLYQEVVLLRQQNNILITELETVKSELQAVATEINNL